MKYLVFIWLVFSLSTVFAQEKGSRFIQVKYTYLIEQVQSENQLIHLESDLKQIKGVDQVKYQYKPEKQTAQFIIYTTQQVRQSEGDEEFNITSLKSAIIKNDLIPNELKEEIVEQ
ncbi:MAG TPA: hypothetical protein PLP65_00515 [Bacteroidales bacterium]|jgi:hypothetical protein|nr:hypothetical protein [Bacteroidales bacterium]HOU97310.1 hypothetical protein [Bacteroidales bacterium]